MTHSSDDNLQFDFHVIWRPLMASMCTCINAAQKLMQIYKNINTDTKKSIIQKINTFQNVICCQVGILSFIYLATIQNHTLEVYTRKTCILIFLGITRSKFQQDHCLLRVFICLVWLYLSLYCQWQSDLALLYLFLDIISIRMLLADHLSFSISQRSHL